MNNWTSSKNFESKEKATSYAVSYFPNCKNESIVMMPSTTCIDVREMVKQNKIDASTSIWNIDNLKSADFKKIYDKKSFFEKTYRKNIKSIIKNCDMNKYHFIYDYIQETVLTIQTKKGKLRLIYADTCCTYNEGIRSWISKAPFRESLKKNGIFALTVMLSRHKIDYPINLNHSYDIISIDKENENQIEKLKMIASDIEQIPESGLITKALISYSDDYRSPMGILIFKKSK